MELIRAATLCVSDLERSQALYTQHLDYKAVESGVISAELAQSWAAPKTAGQPYCVLQPASGAPVFIRHIEQPPIPDYRPLRSYGWAAIEICTQDTLTIHERMKTTPFEIIGPPKELDGMPAIFPMQVKGLDEEIVYLTEIRDNLPQYDLPRADSLIDKLFILVMACRDIEKTGLWFEKHLRLIAGRRMEIVYNMINDAFDLPNTTKHPLATLTHERDVFLEIDDYPQNTIDRPRHNDMLPPAAAIGSFIHPAFQSLKTINKDHWITPPQKHDGIIYNGKQSAALHDPDGTLIEIIEA